MGPPPTGDSHQETDSLSPDTPPGKESSLPLPPSKRPPDDFGDYRFVELLGKGAFGSVYKVWSESKLRFEAMKVLNPSDAVDAAQLESFRYEVQRTANVRSPNVVQVFHVDALPDGRPFFTMEYLGGGRLDHCCDHNRCSLEDRIRAVADVCNAVQRMHELNLVHCDIKPANIVVDNEAGSLTPKLVDFGLASQRAFRPSPASVPRGTIPYMAPEQLESRGGEPDRSWDVYALGATLYQLLGGSCPVEHFPDLGSPPEVLAAYVRKTPVRPLWERESLIGSPKPEDLAAARRLSVEAFDKELHNPWLDAVVRRALAKDRADRYASAGDMATSLREFLSGDRPHIVPPTAADRVREFTRRRRRILAGSAFFLLLAVTIAIGIARHHATLDAQIASHLHEGLSAVDPQYAIDSFDAALAIDPTRSDVRLHLAAAWVAHGDAKRALESIRAIFASDPNYAKARAVIKRLCQVANLADAPCNEVADDTAIPLEDEYYYALALGPNEAAMAISFLTRAMDAPQATFNDRFNARLARTVRYYETCNQEAMAFDAQWLVETVPDSAVAWNLQGLSCVMGDNNEQALMAFNRAISLNPTTPTPYLNRAALYNHNTQYAAALADADHAKSLAGSLNKRLDAVRVVAWLGRGDLSSAESLCVNLFEYTDAESHTHVACAELWKRRERWDMEWTAADWAVKVVERGAPCASRLAEVLCARGIAATHVERFAEAVTDFDRAEALTPERWRTDYNFPYARAKTLMFTGDLPRAVADFKLVAQLLGDRPQRTFAYLMIWDALSDLDDEPGAAEALDAAQVAAGDDPRRTSIVDHCAGRAEAFAIWQHTSDDTVYQVDAYYYLGIAAKHRGERDQALAYFKSCRDIHRPSSLEWQLAKAQQLRLAGR